MKWRGGEGGGETGTRLMIDATEKTKDELRFGDNGETKPEDGGAGNFGAEQTREGPDVALYEPITL